jgi:hypothetical protein
MGSSLPVSKLFACAALAIAALLAGCGDQAMGALCAPEGAAPALRPAANVAKGPMRVFWDGSESIAGYVDGATDSVRPLGDLQPLLASHAREAGVQAQWLRFGERITPLPSGSGLASTGFYRCGRQANCDNQESRIDSVLTRIADRTGPGLDVVVTDLWLSNTAFQGSAEIALGQPIRAVLAKGKSIGVIGLRAPYAGPVYDVPGVGTHSGAHERPLFILLVGSRTEVLAAYRTLSRSGSPALSGDRSKFALFTPEPATAWLGASAPVQTTGDIAAQRLIDGDQSEALPQVRVSLDQLRTGQASLRIPVVADARILPGAVWRGKLGGQTQVWRRAGGCGAGAWESQPALSGAWRPDGPDGATFTLDARSTAALVAGSDYLIQGQLTTNNFTAAPPETKWMRDWSVSPDRARAVSAASPAFFPTLNLAAFAEQLEAGLRETTPPQGLPLASLAVLVRVEP